MTELTEVCEKLDKTTDDIMNTLHQILLCQRELEEDMKHGFLMMSKARYNIGVTRVSALQYKEDDLEEAITKVNLTQGDEGSATFSLCDSKGGETISSSTVRQRKDNKSTTLVENLTNKIEGVNLNAEENSSTSEPCDKTIKKRDPLNWFGVLVPQALRQSQSMFKRATEKCCDIASLKAQLLSLRQEHKQLMLRKREIMPPATEISDHSDYDTGSDLNSGTESS